MLSNSQYNTVERIYEERRNRARNLKDERTKKLHELFPEIAEVDRQLIEGSFRAARLAISGNDSELSTLDEKNGRLIEKKQILIESHGYPADYLDDVYFCSKCRDTGRYKEEGKDEEKKCECFYKTVIDCFFLDENRKKLLDRENFDEFNVNLYDKSKFDKESGKTEYQIMMNTVATAKKMLKAYGTKDFNEQFPTGKFNMIINGNVGAGKTFLANCIAKELLDRGLGVLYMTAVDFFEMARNLALSKDDERDSESAEIIGSADCLIIDDLGTENTTTFSASQLFAWIERRQLAKKPVIITTNLSMAQIQERYSERVSSRILAYYEFLNMPGGDNRNRQV